jgi:hypothetical protein
MQSVSLDQAHTILDKIKTGASPEAIVRHIKTGDASIQVQWEVQTCRQYRFPYIAAMPDYLLSSTNKYLTALVFDASVTGRFGPEEKWPSNATIPADKVAYLKPYFIATISDARFENVDLAKWTDVTSDSRLLGNLLHAYFLHAYPAFPAFQKDLFLDDLVNGRKRFCSKLLVNAILAQACVCLCHLNSFCCVLI